MIFALIFEILVPLLAEMLLNALVILALGAFTLLIEIGSYLVSSGLVNGVVNLAAYLF
jgi:hypothetical protein